MMTFPLTLLDDEFRDPREEEVLFLNRNTNRMLKLITDEMTMKETTTMTGIGVESLNKTLEDKYCMHLEKKDDEELEAD